MQVKAKKIKSIFEIIVADMLWGIGFVATVWLLQSFTLFQSLFLRFAIIAVVCAPYIFLKFNFYKIRSSLKTAFLPALFLSGEIFFQMLGLQHTTATKAGFITILFIIVVPLIEKIIFFKKIHIIHWAWVLISIVGVKFILGGEILSWLNFGDAMMLISCVFASMHILFIDRLSNKIDSPFAFNIYQVFWGFLFSVPLIFIDPIRHDQNYTLISIVGLIIISLGTTLLAFYFQLLAQKNISASDSSLLFILESPFAAFFSVYFLNEKLVFMQLVGCALVICAAVGVVLSSSQKNDQVS